MLNLKIVIIFFFIVFRSYGSNDEDIAVILNHLRRSEYDLAQIHIKKIDDNDLKSESQEYLNILFRGNFQNFNKKKEFEENSLVKNLSLLNEGLRIYLEIGNEVEALNVLQAGLELARNRKDAILVCEISKIILKIYERFNQEINDQSYMFFLKTHADYAYDQLEQKINTYFEYRITQRYSYKNPSKIEKSYKRANNFLIDSPPFLRARLNITNSAYHQLAKKDLDSSNYYLNKAKKTLQNLDGYFENERNAAVDINFSVLSFLEGDTARAIEQIERISLGSDDYIYRLLAKYISYWKFQYYQSNGDELVGLQNYKTYLENELSHNQAKNLQVVSNFETKYQTERKENQILEEKQKTRINRNLLIAVTLALIFGSGIAVLLQKNTIKKRRLAEQEALLEQQKVEVLLKEQELTSIDAMVAGQEKERQKVANELHDDLGSLMATVKLHFDNVRVVETDPALRNAQRLLDEAYQKIRSMAHSKNSGVMANQGLLPAVKKMAQTINQTNALQINVEDFGLGERLDNSLELTIFRIIQELTANVIKHAGASTANIQFTQHEDNLNIIVEDNGIGFDMSIVQRESKGMGLGTIEKRIEHLEGRFTVDSILGKGTSILMDIPI